MTGKDVRAVTGKDSRAITGEFVWAVTVTGKGARARVEDECEGGIVGKAVGGRANERSLVQTGEQHFSTPGIIS